MTERVPTGSRPARAMHMALAKILENDLYLWMTRDEFVAHLVEATGSGVALYALERIYDGLMKEAGLEPLGQEAAPIWKNRAYKAQAIWIDEADFITAEERKTIEQKLEEFKK